MRRTAAGPDLEPLPDDAHLLQPFLHLAAERPQRVLASVRRGDEFVDLTVGELHDRVRRLAAGLIASGVAPGDRVALMAGTRLEWLLMDFAILAAGGVTVPIYDTSSAEQIQWIVSDSEAVALVVETPQMRGIAEEVSASMPSCREIIVIDEGGLPELERRAGDVEPTAVDDRVAALRADDLATIIYTSGTTGRPKGCMLSHRNLGINVLQSKQAVGPALRPDETGMLFLPLAHSLTKGYALFGVQHAMRAAFATDIAHLPEELPMARPTVIAAVPRIFEKVYEGARQKAADDGKGRIFDAAAKVAVSWSEQRTAGRVRPTTAAAHWVFDRLVYGKIRAAFGSQLRFAFSGGGPLGERLTHFFAGIGVDIYEGYGLTETSPTLTINCPGAWKPGTVGRPLAGTTVKIAPDGEILVKGPQVFRGYWHAEEATRATFDADGWFLTGDIGELDEDGYLRITGRKKEIIVTAAGKNVAPAPLEDRLRSHALVSQAVVIGEGKPFIAALMTLDEAALERWCEHHGRTGAALADVIDMPELRHEVGLAVEHANALVSRAESIREFAILPRELTIEADELTPTLKVRRSTVERAYADIIEGIYGPED